MSKRAYYNRQNAGSAGFSPLQIPRFMMSTDSPAYAEIAKMSNDAKVLYALLLDRLSLNDMSINFLENPWHNDEKMPVKLHGGYDERGNAYVHFQLTEMQTQLGVSYDSVLSAIEELLAHSMIEIIEAHTENGEPSRIYPLTFPLKPLAALAPST
jgi:hypothetical protein